jgi:16S rRNA (cytidine1402-2'-O)-methyltransferase
MERQGTLHIVATPIGNLEDITLRALRILGEVDYILCEDTRVTGKLLAHYGIKKMLRRYDAHSSERAHENILADLKAGKRIALVSDAGTPGISDPGAFLAARARGAGARLEVAPGASALTAALSLAGIYGNRFTFLGYAPQKKGRETFFAELPAHVQPVVFFESTHRFMKALERLKALEAAQPRAIKVTVARELTKLHEEVAVGTPTEVYKRFSAEPLRQKGEFVLIVSCA